MKQIKFYGIGGQGVVTAAKVLSMAVSLYENEYAVTIPSYGHERRGAPVYTDIIIDSEPVKLNCCVYEPDVVVVLDATIPEKHVDVSAGMHDGTILVLNTGDRAKAQEYRDNYGFSQIYYVDATEIALQNIGRNIPNGSILGGLAKTGLVSVDSVEKAIIDFFGEKAGVKNAAAANAAYEATEKI